MWLYILLAVISLFVLKGIYTGIIRPYKLFSFYKKQLKEKNYKSFNFPFVPFAAPSIMNAITEQKKYKDAYYTTKYDGIKYDLVLTNIASQILLVLISPTLIQHFYQLDGTPTYIKQQQFIKSLRRIVDNTITFSEGEVWKTKRRFMTSFFNFNYINKEFGTIVNIVNRKLAEASNGKDSFEVYILELIQQMTSATIVQLFFGGGSTEAQNLQIDGIKVSSYMRTIVQHLGEQALDPVAFMLGQSFPEKNLRAKDRLVTRQLQKYKQFATNFVRNRIYEIKQGKSKKEDYVQKIYQSVKQEQRTPQFVTKIMFDFSSLYVAGTDTTSHSAMMVMYYTMIYPQATKKVQEQIQKYIKTDEDVNYQNVKEMIYLDCFVHEALRLYQPANGIFIREATQDHMLGDIKVTKGTLIMTSSMTNHYNPNNFENPTQFKPQRWMGEQGNLKMPQPYTWLTFSAGARSCIGKQLALTEIKIIVIQMLRKFKMSMETTDLIMKMNNFSYQPQALKTKFVKK